LEFKAAQAAETRHSLMRTQMGGRSQGVKSANLHPDLTNSLDLDLHIIELSAADVFD
jgi:hypothetical protein